MSASLATITSARSAEDHHHERQQWHASCDLGWDDIHHHNISTGDRGCAGEHQLNDPIAFPTRLSHSQVVCQIAHLSINPRSRLLPNLHVLLRNNL
jgi:hypothetical protein